MNAIVAGFLWILVAIIVIAILAVGFGMWQITRNVRKETDTLFVQAMKQKQTIATEELLQDFPAPVRRYMAYSGVVGKPIPRTVRLKYTGKFRQTPAGIWQALTAEEYYTVNPPLFLWIGTIRVIGLPIVRVTDRYQDGHGSILVKIGGLLSLNALKGPEADQGSMMRYLNEMTAFPAAYLNDNISWKAIDNQSAEVTLTDSGNTATATMYFDDEGKMTSFVAKRYRTVGSGYSLETWSTPMASYGEFAGLRLPAGGQGVWNLKDGDFAYIEVNLTEVEYDVKGAY